MTSNFTNSARTPNQKFILQNPGIDTDLISVTVRPNEQSTKSVKYSRQDSLFDIKSDSKVYYLQEVEDERYQIILLRNIHLKYTLHTIEQLHQVIMRH